MRRLSAILDDKGKARRSRERRESAMVMRSQAAAEALQKRLALRRARLRSIAKMIDLSLVWEWLEGTENDDEDDDDVVEELRESMEDAEQRDDRAVGVVTSLIASRATALGEHLEIDGDDETCEAIQGLQSLVGLQVSAPSYDLATGQFLCKVVLPVRGGTRVVSTHRSWRDLVALRKGLVKRLDTARGLPKLPKPRPLSELKRSARNLLSKHKGDRTWQRSKLDQVNAWLSRVASFVADATEASVTFEQRSKRGEANEFLEDFYFKFGKAVTIKDDDL